MKIEEIIEKIKNMNPIEKLDFLFKIYGEVEEKKELEELIKNSMEELSFERTPVDIRLSFKEIKNEEKSEIEEKINNENESNKSRNYIPNYVTIKFIPEEDIIFWSGENKPSKKYYKLLKTKKYEVVW